MKFEFGKYTEITDYAFKHNPEYKKSGYVRVFICPDVNTFWLVRILKDYDINYNKTKGMYLMERNNIEKDYKWEVLSEDELEEIIENDNFENYDMVESTDIEELIRMLDAGFGILNLKK